MAFSVQGKSAIVTGAGSGFPIAPFIEILLLTKSGINLSFANLLLSRGCNVLFADLKLRKEAEDVVKEHMAPKNAKLGKAAFQETDVSEWKHLERMFKVAESIFGRIDIVVPGAGIYEPVSFRSSSVD